jgi:hypothetical protein
MLIKVISEINYSNYFIVQIYSTSMNNQIKYFHYFFNTKFLKFSMYFILITHLDLDVKFSLKPLDLHLN